LWAGTGRNCLYESAGAASTKRKEALRRGKSEKKI